jgi:antitoxin Phd
MKTWQVHDAKAHFSELIDACLEEGAQVVTRRGIETAVVVPIDEWKRLNSLMQHSLKSLLLSNEDRLELDLLPRGNARRRTTEIN